MGLIAARDALRVLEHTERMVAIELIRAVQALDLRLDLQPDTAPGSGVAEARCRVRVLIARFEQDREPGPSLERAFEPVHGGALADLADPPSRIAASWLGPDPRWPDAPSSAAVVC